jgi:cytochrome b
MIPKPAPAALTVVWDPLVRAAHWLLVVSVSVAWLTRHASGKWHEWLGYTVLGIVCVRVLWGFFGSRHARFSDFVSGPRKTLYYARRLLQGREERHIGHNPLGAWMIVAFIFTITGVCVSGWLYTTDRFWGIEWVETLHRTASNALWVLVLLHVAGVVYTSLRHRENLVGAMLHGKKSVPVNSAANAERHYSDERGAEHHDAHRSTHGAPIAEEIIRDRANDQRS